MTPERWEQVGRLYREASRLRPAERAAFLDHACTDDEALRREVESLLTAEESAGVVVSAEADGDAARRRMLVEDKGPSLVGRRLGRYQVLSLLGAGGMGEVYRARDTRLGREAALKVLPAAFSAGAERLLRFKREAHAASSLNHPHILTIYEIGVEDGHHYIAAECVEGESLRRRMARGRMSLPEALDVAIQIASALSAAHTAGIVHRDIKPENVMLRPDRIVKVLDFGLAKLVGAEPEETGAEAPTKILPDTTPGVVMGTTPYMSPEQARGLEVDARTDLWSLGVVLYELVAGRVPFAGPTTSDVIASILTNEPTGLHRFAPPELARIVAKALKKERGERYQTAEELCLDLKNLRSRLEFEAELARNQTSAGGSTRLAAGDRPTLLDTARTAAPPAETGGAGGDTGPATGTARVAWGAGRNRRLALIVLALLAAAAASVFAYSRYFSGGGTTAAPRSVAVLPFTNTSGDPETEYLSDGISESLINQLSQMPGVKVIARSSSFKYKGKETDPREAARSLGVETVVTGRVAQRGDQLHISAELMDAREGTQVWGHQYTRPAADLLVVQGEISGEIAERLRLRLSPAERRQLARRETVNPQAYELQLRGLYHWRKGGIENWKKAVSYYEQAIAADPSYALAYARLAGSYKSLVGNSVLDPKEFTPKAEAAAHRALELDESNADAHYALANLRTDAWDWEAAEREFKRAVELNPNLAGARNAYSAYLSVVGRHDDAVAEIRRAREIDPLSLIVHANVGYRLYFARRHDEAIQSLNQTLEMDPNFDLAHIMLGYAYAAKGMYGEAVAAYEEAIRRGADTPSVHISLGAAYARAGERERARAILGRLQQGREYVSPGELAILHAELGEREQAFASLEQAYAAHDLQLQYLGADPAFDSLRGDPRFQDLLRRIGLAA